MNEQELEQQITQLLEAAKNGDEQAAALLIQLAATGAMVMILQQQLQQLNAATMARRGAKLDYINHLRGECPSGYLKSGGRCVKCEQAELARQSKKQDPIEEYKCGRKVRKKAEGGVTAKPRGKTQREEHKFQKNYQQTYTDYDDNGETVYNSSTGTKTIKETNPMTGKTTIRTEKMSDSDYKYIRSQSSKTKSKRR